MRVTTNTLRNYSSSTLLQLVVDCSSFGRKRVKKNIRNISHHANNILQVLFISIKRKRESKFSFKFFVI